MKTIKRDTFSPLKHLVSMIQWAYTLDIVDGKILKIVSFRDVKSYDYKNVLDLLLSLITWYNFIK